MKRWVTSASRVFFGNAGLNRRKPIDLANAPSSIFSAPSCLALLAGRSGHAQFYRIDLQAEKLDVPAGPWQVAQVLDLRADRSRLGPVRQGFNNEHTSANFSQPLATGAAAVLSRRSCRPGPALALGSQCAFSPSPSAKTMRANAEHAEAELVADFLELPARQHLSRAAGRGRNHPSAMASM